MLGSIIQIVLEQPTNMGVTSTIDLSISADLEMVSKGATAEPFFTIGKFSYPIQRALTKNKLGNIYFKEKKSKYQRSQKLNSYFHDAGQCYWFDLRKLKNIKSLDNKTKAVELKEFEFLDVDTPEDLNNLKKIFKSNLHE